ncbi:Oxoglutarate/iron-dependent dioxygenase [Penicillium taxi]|uniref:Oxoglutarate/iron-dependent dioxygenase n=1 Tax=Penicillium taxi TaxID=168475 RepID=UPI00254510FF|nr:Oxoglutarate/iron-dependent dioxygenase [Penicillium taxi]KAJ5908332.1 Oxoglutarate/iron-dependent dioxygenase [Penicillium taxi]
MASTKRSLPSALADNVSIPLSKIPKTAKHSTITRGKSARIAVAALEGRPSQESEDKTLTSDDKNFEADGTRSSDNTSLEPFEIEQVHGEPPAWADNRASLGDSLAWFRCRQGACYIIAGGCKGFLIDGDAGTRSYIDDEVIITRIGGNCGKEDDGSLTLSKNQDMSDTRPRSMLETKEQGCALGLIIGSKNTALNRRLPHRLNVMAHFQITDMWFEKMGKYAGLKVRFEKLNLTKQSWWSAKNSPPPLQYEFRDFNKKPERQMCQECGQESTRVFQECWMCLHPKCVSFWTAENNKTPTDLTYSSDFLNSRCHPDPSIQPQHELKTDLLSTFKEEGSLECFSAVSWRGIVCPNCFKCIPREYWSGWKCDNCSFEKWFPMPVISLRSIMPNHELAAIKRVVQFQGKTMRPNFDNLSLAPYRKYTYLLPGVGTITHMVSNSAINSRKGGPDDLFHDLQVKDLGLRRYPLEQSMVSGTLTSHFAVNYGMPYKYVVAVKSKGFDEAPDVILHSLGRLTWATEQALATTGDEFLPPNELLLLGYLEDMKIGFHDDGESSLGPTITTLSLGSQATMEIRMKGKYYHGKTKSKLLSDDVVLEGCRFEEERRELKGRVLAGETTQAEYDSERSILLKARAGEAPSFIKMDLCHGDFVVMHGENLQKYYEHSVNRIDKLRFALTARYIKPNQVDKSEHHKGDFTLTPAQTYHGHGD